MRLIDADALKIEIACLHGSDHKTIQYLNHAPTVDAVPVIRCKDCSYYGAKERGKCPLWCAFIYPEGYCFRAERREE